MPFGVRTRPLRSAVCERERSKVPRTLLPFGRSTSPPEVAACFEAARVPVGTADSATRAYATATSITQPAERAIGRDHIAPTGATVGPGRAMPAATCETGNSGSW